MFGSIPNEAPEDLVKLTWMLREGRGSIADPSMWTLKASVAGLWNDYLFANIGADLHFLGTFLVVGLYTLFGYRALKICAECPGSVRSVDRHRADHLDSRAGSNSYRNIAHLDSGNRPTAALHELWRFIAIVLPGGSGAAGQHLASATREEGPLCAFYSRVGGLAATSIPFSP